MAKEGHGMKKGGRRGESMPPEQAGRPGRGEPRGGHRTREEGMREVLDTRGTEGANPEGVGEGSVLNPQGKSTKTEAQPQDLLGKGPTQVPGGGDGGVITPTVISTVLPRATERGSGGVGKGSRDARPM